MQKDCIYCHIKSGELAAHTVYEDDDVIAFLDIKPVSKGHVLVVPKEHVEQIDEARGMEFMWDSIVELSTAVEKAFEPDGVNILMNNGEAAGQDVEHLHAHVIPRYEDGGTDLYEAPDKNRSKLEDPEGLAEKIRNSF